MTAVTEYKMSGATVQDWTETKVVLAFDDHRAVKYRVYRDGGAHFLENRDVTDSLIHTLELPDRMKLDKNSYDVLLRYVLLDVVAA
jgi:hypothetical protein